MNTQLKNEQQQLKQLQAGKKHLELFEKHCLQRDRLAAEQNEELRRHLAQSQNVEEGDEDSMWM